MRPLPIEPLADMPELTLGLSVIRGRPTPVLDGHKLLGSRLRGSARRFVTIRLGPTRTVALAVDEVLGVRSVTQGELDELPALARATGADPVSALGTLDRELLVILEHARLLSEADWQRLEAATP